MYIFYRWMYRINKQEEKEKANISESSTNINILNNI